jgi:hypothetical protein
MKIGEKENLILLPTKVPQTERKENGFYDNGHKPKLRPRNVPGWN